MYVATNDDLLKQLRATAERISIGSLFPFILDTSLAICDLYLTNETHSSAAETNAA